MSRVGQGKRSGGAARGRCRARPVGPHELRPTDLLTAFFGLGLMFVALAVVSAVLYAATGWTPGRWLALHLAFLGGVSQLVIGASQFFVGAFLATSPPPRTLVRSQLAAWNLGTVAVTVGVTWRIPDLAVAGGGLLLLGLALLIMALAGLQRRSLQRAPWAARWYYACAAFLAFGVVAGALLAAGASWRYGSLLGAHLVLNVAGWFGTAIVGTLHTFFPSLTHTRLRFPALQRVAFAGWIGGTALLACGYGLDTAAAVAGGWIGLCIGASAMVVNLLASVHDATEALPLPARLVAVGQCFLVVGLLATLTQGPDGPLRGPERSALAVLLLAGWLGMTVVGSLLQLLSVLARVRNLRRVLPRRRARGDAAPPVLAALGVFGLAAGLLLPVETLMGPAAGVLALTYAVLMVRVTGLAVRAIRHGELRI